MNLRINRNSVVVVAVCLAVTVLLPSAPIAAQDSEGGSGSKIVTSIPRTMSYQGILKDSGGDPVVDSVYNVTFRIFDILSGGTSLWDETLPCTTSAGYFSTIFSNVNLPFDEDYWLELEVGGDILDPRQKINMVGYAAVADTADYAFTSPGGGGGGWVDDGTVVRLETSSDRVGIGTSSPAGKLHVAADSNFGVVGTVIPTGGDDYAGVVGYVDGGSGTNTGVSGNAGNGNINRGVSGQAEGSGSENIGVFGYAQGGTINWAGYFDGDVGIENDLEVMDKAIIGPGHNNTGTNSFTVGQSNSATGLASFAAGRRAQAIHNGTFVWGDDTEDDFQSTADNQFLIRATGGVGIGTNSPTAGLHVNSESGVSSDNIGILGNAANGTYNKGIVGEAHGLSDENIGVYGYAEGGDDNWAGYFNGDVGVAQNVEIQGKAAIGTTNPTSRLEIGSSDSIAVKITSDYEGDGRGLDVEVTDASNVGIAVSGRSFAASGTGGQFFGELYGVSGLSSEVGVYGLGYIGIKGEVLQMGSLAASFIGDVHTDGAMEITDRVAIGSGDTSVGNNTLTVGQNNSAEGNNSVAAGLDNSAGGNNSFAAGIRAKADHNSTFVWGDSTDADFASTADNQFLVRASGGVGIGTNSPQGALDVSSTTGAFIVPRMTTVERDALTPVNGMIIYNIGTNRFNFYENGAWVIK